MNIYSYPEYHKISYSFGVEREADFIEAVFKRYAGSNVKSVLDIGCGSGRHMVELSRRGYDVFGIDKNPRM